MPLPIIACMCQDNLSARERSSRCSCSRAQNMTGHKDASTLPRLAFCRDPRSCRRCIVLRAPGQAQTACRRELTLSGRPPPVKQQCASARFAARLPGACDARVCKCLHLAGSLCFSLSPSAPPRFFGLPLPPVLQDLAQLSSSRPSLPWWDRAE